MTFMIAYYPLLKFALVFLVFAGAVYAYTKRHFKTAGALAVLIAIFMIFAPVKIDGTNVDKHNKRQHEVRTQEYKSVTSDAVIVHVKKPTFQERMAAENARSLNANASTLDGLIPSPIVDGPIETIQTEEITLEVITIEEATNATRN